MEAEFQELIHSSRGMLSANEASELREFIEARQYALAIEALCGILVDETSTSRPSCTPGFTAWSRSWMALTRTSWRA